jgi:2-iminoacetate synthase
MSFLEVMDEWSDFDFGAYLANIGEKDIIKSIEKEILTEFDFINLLSDMALPHLEVMAVKSKYITLQYFGRTIQLYIPLYLSNYCNNACAYCGFNLRNNIKRSRLTIEEIEENAVAIAATGLQHILILTGESREMTPLPYMTGAVKLLKKYFASVSVEIYPMNIPDYKELIEAGADGLTIYQEVYDRKLYDRVHISGPKKNYEYRLGAPERGAEALFRSITIGPLYGLGDPVREAFFCGLHAKYLFMNYPASEINLSLPRLNEAEGHFNAINPLSDKKFVQFITAFRIFLPRTGITVSTREAADLRNNLIGLGITKMSAGSRTCVGGYSGSIAGSVPQFEILDHRSVEEIARIISSRGYDPVFKDW